MAKNKDGLEAGKLLTPKELQAHKLAQRNKPAKQEPKK